MPESRQLTCKELVELVTDYLEGAMSPCERTRFDEHLKSCPFCQIYLEQIRQTIRAVGHLPEQTLSAQARETLLTHFQRWRIKE